MLRDILFCLKQNLAGSDLAASLRYRSRYPGLRVSPAARISGPGALAYGEGCSLAARARLILNRESRVELGDRCRVDEDAEIQPDRGTIRIGEETSVQKRCTLIGDLEIGAYCLFAPSVFVSSGAHRFDLRPELLIRDQDDSGPALDDYNRRVTIEDDCWIGANVVILRGVRIGKGCVIGANSVVTRDIPPYAIAAGAPAKVIKARLDFVAKAAISSGDERDWPYFYSGFQLRKSRMDGGPGLAVRAGFSVCLAGGGSLIKLEILPGSEEYVIAHGGQEKIIGPAGGILSFRAHAEDERGIYAFRVQSGNAKDMPPRIGLRVSRAFLG